MDPTPGKWRETDTDAELQSDDEAPRRTWPYRKPEPPPQEAVVDVNVAANSNTSPSRQDAADPDNVIPMPRGRQPAIEDVGDPVGPTVALRQPNPAAAAQPEPASEATLIPEVIYAPAPVAEAGINVRITERTADFTVPVTEAQLPFQLSGAETPSDQLALDFDVLEPGRISQDHDDEPDQAVIADEPVEAVLVDETEYRQSESEVIEPDEIIIGQDQDDPMLRVAARFAAARKPAE